MNSGGWTDICELLEVGERNGKVPSNFFPICFNPYPVGANAKQREHPSGADSSGPGQDKIAE